MTLRVAYRHKPWKKKALNTSVTTYTYGTWGPFLSSSMHKPIIWLSNIYYIPTSVLRRNPISSFALKLGHRGPAYRVNGPSREWFRTCTLWLCCRMSLRGYQVGWTFVSWKLLQIVPYLSPCVRACWLSGIRPVVVRSQRWKEVDPLLFAKHCEKLLPNWHAHHLNHWREGIRATSFRKLAPCLLTVERVRKSSPT